MDINFVLDMLEPWFIGGILLFAIWEPKVPRWLKRKKRIKEGIDYAYK